MMHIKKKYQPFVAVLAVVGLGLVVRYVVTNLLSKKVAGEVPVTPDALPYIPTEAAIPEGTTMPAVIVQQGQQGQQGQEQGQQEWAPSESSYYQSY